MRIKAKANIVVIGAGEAFDSGLGNTSYLFRAPKLPTILFDCGYQIPERLWRGSFHQKIDCIFFTHLHADHSFGVVPLLARFWEEGRSKPIDIIGPRGTDRFVLRLLNMGYPGLIKRIKFPLRFITLNPNSPIRLGKLLISCAPTTHSVLNYTIRVDLPGKRALSFAISGDGQITEKSKKLVHDVEVLLQEVYGEKPEIPVHADLETVSKWVNQTSISKIVVSHFCRSMKGRLRSRIQANSKGSPQWIVARSGLKISL